MKTTITRIPRQLGLTQLMRRYHGETGDIRQDILKQIRQRVISTYMQHNQELNGQIRTIEEIGEYLQIQDKEVMQIIGDLGKEMMTGGGYEAFSAAWVYLTSKNALGQANLAFQQGKMLVEAQKNKYQPFLSSAANQAIANMTSATRAMMDFLKTISPQGPNTQVLIQNNLSNGVPAEKAIGPNEAVMLISAEKGHKSLLDDDAQKSALLAQYSEMLPNLPEVDARKQIGIDENIGMVQLPTSLPIPKPRKHNTRAEDLGTFIPE